MSWLPSSAAYRITPAGRVVRFTVWLGVAVFVVGVLAAWFGPHHSLITFGLLVGGIAVIFVGVGIANLFGDFEEVPVPAPVQPDKTPSRQTVYGDARPATEREIHEALRDKNHSGNSGYLYED